MGKTFGLVSRTETWETSGSSATILSSLLKAANDLGGRLQSTSNDELVEMKFGSRTNYRMFGILSKPSNRPLVLRLQVKSMSESRAEIQVEALSDPGWYAAPVLTLSLAKKQYAEAFSRIFNGLQEAIPLASEG